jgi:hypothetical protein
VKAAESLEKRRAGFCIRGLKAHGHPGRELRPQGLGGLPPQPARQVLPLAENRGGRAWGRLSTPGAGGRAVVSARIVIGIEQVGDDDASADVGAAPATLQLPVPTKSELP